MDLDEDRIDAAVLALLHLTLHDARRAWKAFDWDGMGRLHRKGWGSNRRREPTRGERPWP